MNEAEATERVDGRTLRYRNRRGEIVDAVLEHVLSHGVTGMSFRSLAQSVGVSHVTLRHHFGTKENLVAEVFGVIAQSQQDLVPTLLPANDDFEPAIRQLWQYWTTDDLQRRLRLFFEVYGHAVQDPDRYRAFFDNAVVDRLDVVTDLAVQAGCPVDDAAAFATGLLAQLRGLQLDLLATSDHARVSRAFDLLVEGLRRSRSGWERGRR